MSATLECRVVEEVTGGTHSVFLAEVERASAVHGAPLAYFRGEFGRVALAQDETAFAELRARVLNRQLPVGEPLNLDAVAADLDVPRGAVYHALARLSGEGLVARDLNGAFVVRPVTLERVEGALRARCAVLLGVVELTVGRIAPDRLHELRRLVDAADPLGVQGLRRPHVEWGDSLVAFQRYLIGLAGGEALTDVFAHVNVAAMIATRQAESPLTGAAHVPAHRGYAELVEA